MNPDLEQKAKELFREAARLSPAERGEFLQAHCSDEQLSDRVQLLLKHDEIAGDAFLRGSSSSGAEASHTCPQQIGRFRIRSVLGHGGMGTVYEAEQDKPQRRVALKVIRSGWMSPATLRRFEFEAEVLARLDHPGIAKVYDAGTADLGDGPHPYFAMELVTGQRLDLYVREANPPIERRLQLFSEICQAVHHAHTKGVIHRDLKPANILITGLGQPKILDFGVARATESDLLATTLHTETGQIIGTLPYMAPEQAAGRAHELDTSSDVYALGVIAYELLSGQMPYSLQGKALHDAVRVICEDEPSRLSSLDRSLRGDVETIVGKALAKDKSERYLTAGELADDVRRYLNYEPIAARPPRAWYQLSRFARRNKLLVAGTAIVVAALVGGTVVSTWQAIRATAERRRADQQAAIAAAVSDFQASMLASADPARLMGDKVTVVDAILAGAKQLDEGKLKDQPLVEAAVRRVIGSTLKGLDRYEEAEANLRRAVELSRKSLPSWHPETAAHMRNLANLLRIRGKHPEAESILKNVLELRQRQLPAGDPDIGDSLNDLADFYVLDVPDFAKAAPLARDAMAIHRKTLAPGARLVSTLSTNTRLLRGEERYSDAEQLAREVVAMCRDTLPPKHPQLAQALRELGDCIHMQGHAQSDGQEKFRQAEQLYRESLQIYRDIVPPGHVEIANSTGMLAHCLEDLNRFSEAEPLRREALEVDRKRLNGKHEFLARALTYLAFDVNALGRPSEAEPLLREALEMARATMPARDKNLAKHSNNYGYILAKLNRSEEAADQFREAVKLARATDAPVDWVVLYELNLARELSKLHRDVEAESSFREALETCRTMAPPDSSQLAGCLNGFGMFLQSRGRLDEADVTFAELYQLSSRGQIDPKLAAVYMGHHGVCLARLGSFRDAEAPLLTAYERLKVTGQSDHPQSYNVMRAIGELCEATDRPVEAVVWRAQLAANRASTRASYPQPSTRPANPAR